MKKPKKKTRSIAGKKMRKVAVGKTSRGVKAAVRKGLHVSSDVMETAGKRLAKAGLKNFGGAVKRAGDTLEHLAD